MRPSLAFASAALALALTGPALAVPSPTPVPAKAIPATPAPIVLERKELVLAMVQLLPAGAGGKASVFSLSDTTTRVTISGFTPGSAAPNLQLFGSIEPGTCASNTPMKHGENLASLTATNSVVAGNVVSSPNGVTTVPLALAKLVGTSIVVTNTTGAPVSCGDITGVMRY